MTHQKLFDHMSQEHGLTLTESEMIEIERICEDPIMEKIYVMEQTLKSQKYMHRIATSVDRKNIGISLTSIEFAISVLKELVE